jgi:hypothetical protein
VKAKAEGGMCLCESLSKWLYICFSVAFSQYAWSAQFVPVQLASGITMELPRDWSYANEQGKQLLLTHVESVGRLSAIRMGEGSELLIFAKYPDPRTYASVTVTVSGPSLSSEMIKGWSNERLLKYGNDLRADFEKSYPVQGNRLVEWLGTRKVVFKGINAIQSRWRRSLQTNPVVYVEQIQIPTKDRLINITLSYREKEKALWEPVVRAIYQSLSF